MKCPECAYETRNKSNLNRHIKTLHASNEAGIACDYCKKQFKHMHNCKRHMENSCPDHPSRQSSEASTSAPAHVCSKCNKSFTRKYAMDKHFEGCKGEINPLGCPHCNAVFTCKSSKSRHVKNCHPMVVSQETDAPAGPSIGQLADTINNTTNHISTQNNHTGDNIVNNNLTIVFQQDQLLDLILDNLDNERFRNAIRGKTGREILLTFTKFVLENPKNQCVMKTNLRSSHAQVHVGEEEWETRPDREVFPKLVADVANTASEFLNMNRSQLGMSRRTYDDVQAFVDYMSDGGYCADDNKAVEVRKDFHHMIQSTKAITHDYTKRKKTPKSSS